MFDLRLFDFKEILTQFLKERKAIDEILDRMHLGNCTRKTTTKMTVGEEISKNFVEVNTLGKREPIKVT